MRTRAFVLALVATACGNSQFITDDPYADGGAESDAGVDTGTGGGAADAGTIDAGTATGGGGSTTGGGSATGGGSTATGGGGSSTIDAGTDAGTVNCATSCAGCCDANNMCQTGTTASACGTAGSSCLTCPSTDTCSADHSCHLDPAAVWKITITEAQTPFPYDATTASDIEMSMWCPSGGTTKITFPKVDNEENPMWNVTGCPLTASALLTSGIDLAAVDADLTGDENVTSRMQWIPTEANLRAGTVTPSQSFGGLDSVTFSFTPP